MPTFIAWLSQYGQMILFIAQILFWLAIAVAALWSTMLFKRLVDARTSGESADVEAVEPESVDEKPDVDEFVD